MKTLQVIVIGIFLASLAIVLNAPMALLTAGSGVFADTIVPLVNPSFDGKFSYRGAPEVEVAEGWDPVWLEGDDRECRAPCFRPEFKPESQIVISGTSQRYFTTFAHQFAAIYQRVPVQQGQWYRFSCNAYTISEPNGRMEAFVGINPWGADVMHRTMIWGEGRAEHYRQWMRLSVTARAFGDQITVAAGSNNSFSTKNNAAYWDDCQLVAVDGVGTDPLPTQTPLPTYTPHPTPEPCQTAEPGGWESGYFDTELFHGTWLRSPWGDRCYDNGDLGEFSCVK